MGTLSQYWIVRVLFVVSPMLTFVCAVLIGVGTFTEDWEYLDFNITMLKLTMEPTGMITIANDTSSYFIVNLERIDGTSQGPTNSTLIPTRRRGGLWRICNVLPDDVYTAHPEVPDCMSYLRIYYTSEEGYYRPTYRIMMQLTRSAETCAIVSILVVGLGLIIGFISVLLHQCVCSMVTGMCMLAGGFYTIFTTSLMVIRTDQLQGTLVTADTFNGSIQSLLDTKTVTNGWSMTIMWLAAVLCLVSSGAWFALLSILRKDMSREIIRYRQFCG